jgi:hypothetical protein
MPGRNGLQLLGNKGRVAHNVADIAGGLESPRTLVSVGEGDVAVFATEDNQGIAVVVEDLAAVVLLLHQRPNLELDSLKGTRRADRREIDQAAGWQDGLRASLGGLVLQNDAQSELVRVGVDGDKRRIAHHLADIRGLSECPGALVGIGESGVDVFAASSNDGLAVVVKGSASESGVLDAGSEADLDGGEGSASGWGSIGSGHGTQSTDLSASLAAIAEDDSHGVVVVAGAVVGAAGVRSGQSTSDGQERKSDSVGIHFAKNGLDVVELVFLERLVWTREFC